MRTLIAIVAGSAVLCGCEPMAESNAVSPTDATVVDGWNTGAGDTSLSSVEYCGHRYVIARVYRGVGICHAGDCWCRAQAALGRKGGSDAED